MPLSKYAVRVPFQNLAFSESAGKACAVFVLTGDQCVTFFTIFKMCRHHVKTVLIWFTFLKGHSAKIKCLQRLISLSRSKSILCQPSEIVFLSSIALLKRKIWRKTFEPISILIPYYFMLRCWRTKVPNFRYCPPVGRRRVLMRIVACYS